MTAGVLQGSPLSGSLFDLVMDTLVAALDQPAPSCDGVVRACADDIAEFSKRAPGVGLMAPVFSDMGAASGLALHGVLVLLLDGASGRVRRRVARISNGAHLLGRTTPSKRKGGRVRSLVGGSGVIAAEGAPIQAVAGAYHMRALPVLSYLAQVAAAPQRLEEAERVEVCRLWRFPPHTVAKHASFSSCHTLPVVINTGQSWPGPINNSPMFDKLQPSLDHHRPTLAGAEFMPEPTDFGPSLARFGSTSANFVPNPAEAGRILPSIGAEFRPGLAGVGPNSPKLGPTSAHAWEFSRPNLANHGHSRSLVQPPFTSVNRHWQSSGRLAGLAT